MIDEFGFPRGSYLPIPHVSTASSSLATLAKRRNTPTNMDPGCYFITMTAPLPSDDYELRRTGTMRPLGDS